MSYVCKRGYKCMCFQCGEKDCEHFESEPPKWVKDIFENEKIKEWWKRISEMNKCTEEYMETHACDSDVPDINVGDTISRQAAIEAINKLEYPSSLMDVKHILFNLPSVQPEQRWIPVTERLPDKEDVYLCCSTSQDIWILRYMMPYYFEEGAFIQFDGDYPVEFSDVIAWMPLPEAWKGESE